MVTFLKEVTKGCLPPSHKQVSKLSTETRTARGPSASYLKTYILLHFSISEINGILQLLAARWKP